MKRILVTGLFTQAGLFAIRRFAQMGLSVTAADCHPLAFGKYSRFVTTRLALPSLRENPVAYAEALLQYLEQEKHDYYFPSFEEILLLAKYRDRLLSLTHSVIPSYAELLPLHDKGLFKSTALRAGVTTPHTLVPTCRDEAEEMLKGIDYPVMLKLRQANNSTGLRFVDGPDLKRLSAIYRDVIRRNNVADDQLPIIQRWIKGPLICTLELANQGQMLGQAMYAGVRTIPRSGGTTVYRKSVDLPACKRASEAIIRHSNWTGFIAFDYIIEESTGEAYVIDCNPRPTLSAILAYHGGCDMLSQWLKIADGQAPEVLPACRENVTTRTDFADNLWLLGTYFQGPESWSVRKAMRKEWWSDKNVHNDIHDSSDVKPTLVLYLFLVYQAIKALFSKIEPSRLYMYYNYYDEADYQKALEASTGSLGPVPAVKAGTSAENALASG